MSFEVIPALDVSEGRLVVWTSDALRPTEAFGGDPLAASSALVEAGAQWIHLVDVDLARTGSVRAAGLIGELAAKANVQAGGSVASDEVVDALLAAGASRVVLGSRALADPSMTRRVIDGFGERLVVGIEVDDGVILPRGTADLRLDLMESVGWLTGAGAWAFLVTSVGRVGRLAGPEVDAVRRVARSGRPVFAAGGLRMVDDLLAVRAAGAAGAVVGRAALDGTLDLVEAIGLVGA